MPPGNREEAKNGLYTAVFGLAIGLALVILYFGGKRLLASRAAVSGPAPSQVPVQPQPPADDPYDTAAPSMLPPVKVKRIEGKPRPARRSMPPAVPQPPVGPDK